METIIRKIDKNQINQDVIEEAGNVLKQGGLVAFPTETVYGLGADALKEEAAKKTYAAKGRPSDNPLIVHIADYEDLKKVAVNIPPETDALAAHFWPGPLTMIFEKSESVPYGTTGGLDTVAVRMPSDPIAAALIRAAGGFVSAPSANTSGRPSPTTAEHVRVDLEGKIDMILDGGAVDIGLESTILDMTVEPPMILRPGAITADMFEEVIGPVGVDETLVNSESKQAPKAPGMKYRHYAPKAKLMIVEGNIREEILAIRQLAYAAHREGKEVGIIATGETVQFYNYGIVKNIGTRENENTIARNLYRVLREFDEEDVDLIYSESFAMNGIGKAIMNRLEKAAGHMHLQATEITKKQKYRRVIFVSEADSAVGPMAAELLCHQDLEQEYIIESGGLVVLFPEPVNQKAEAIMKSAPDDGAQVADSYTVADSVDLIVILPAYGSGNKADAVYNTVTLYKEGVAVLNVLNSAALVGDFGNGGVQIYRNLVIFHCVAQEGGVCKAGSLSGNEVTGVLDDDRVFSVVEQHIVSCFAGGLAAAYKQNLIADIDLILEHLSEGERLVKAFDVGHGSGNRAACYDDIVKAVQSAEIVDLGVEANVDALLFDLVAVPADELLVVFLEGHCGCGEEQASELSGLFKYGGDVAALLENERALHAADAAAYDGDFFGFLCGNYLVAIVLHGGRVQSAACKMQRVTKMLNVGGACELGHVEAAVVTADTGLYLVFVSGLYFMDPVVINEILTCYCNCVELACLDLLGGLNGIHSPCADYGLIGELLNMLNILKVAVIGHILRRMCPVPGVIGAVVAIEHIVACIGQILDCPLGLLHVTAELLEVGLVGHCALTPVLGLGND